MDNNRIDRILGEGYNCSQTVLIYFCDRLGLDESIAAKISQPFESGMFMGRICGAVSGAYMVLGLAFGDGRNRGELKSMIEAFNNRFESKNGSLECEDLLGINISLDGDMKKAYDSGAIGRVCPGSIKSAVEILESMLQNK